MITSTNKVNISVFNYCYTYSRLFNDLPPSGATTTEVSSPPYIISFLLGLISQCLLILPQGSFSLPVTRAVGSLPSCRLMILTS